MCVVVMAGIMYRFNLSREEEARSGLGGELGRELGVGVPWTGYHSLASR